MKTGKYSERDLPDYSSRNFEERGFTVGIGGYVEQDHVDLADPDPSYKDQ